MMPVIRISDETYARLQRHAKPFEDTTPESVILKALAALDMMDGDVPAPAKRASVKRDEAQKLPQREFRYPLLMTLLKFGGRAQAKDVRAVLGPIMAPKLSEGDYENVSTGDPRWWNATCWERSDLVKEGLMRDDSERGVWEISEAGKRLEATLHRKENGEDVSIAGGALADMAERYWRRPVGARPFVMIGDVVFDPVLLRRTDELPLPVVSANILKQNGIVYIGDLVQLTQQEFLSLPTSGRKSFELIGEAVAGLGLTFGMKLPGGPTKWSELLNAN
jgi:hypothetical protein